MKIPAVVVAIFLCLFAMPAVAAEGEIKLTLLRSSDKGVDTEGIGTTVYGLALSPDGKHALVGGDLVSSIVVLWNIETGENDQFFDIFESHIDGSTYAPALSPDGKLAAVSTTAGKLFFFELPSGNLLKKLELPMFSINVSFSPDSRQAAVVDMVGTLQLIDLADGKMPFSISRSKSAHRSSGSTVAWSGNGKQLVTVSSDTTAALWDVETLEEKHRLPHEDWVWSAAYSQDSKVVATGTGGEVKGNPAVQNYQLGSDNTVRLWDAATGKLLHELKGHAHIVHCLAFTPDNKRLVSGSFDKTLRVWDVATGKELAKVEGKGWVTSVGITPDSKTIVASGGTDKHGEVWSQFPEERVRVFRIQE